MTKINSSFPLSVEDYKPVYFTKILHIERESRLKEISLKIVAFALYFICSLFLVLPLRDAWNYLYNKDIDKEIAENKQIDEKNKRLEVQEKQQDLEDYSLIYQAEERAENFVDQLEAIKVDIESKNNKMLSVYLTTLALSYIADNIYFIPDESPKFSICTLALAGLILAGGESKENSLLRKVSDKVEGSLARVFDIVATPFKCCIKA